MTLREIMTACHLLDAQYRNLDIMIREKASEEKRHEQYVYYDGMRTMVEDLLLGSDYDLIRDSGIHGIVER